METLSPGWRRLFALEVPICLATAMWWAFDPSGFLALSFGLPPTEGGSLLVRQLAGVLVSILVWTYGRWLAAGAVELRAFRYFQEGLLLGDVFLVAEGIRAFSLPGASSGAAVAQVCMATLWGAVRVRFLLRP